MPEQLIGAVRFSNLGMAATVPLDVWEEVPCWPQEWLPHGRGDEK